MKKVFFLLLLTSFSSFAQTISVKDNFYLYKDINLLEKDNIPYYVVDNQIVKVLKEALYKGQIGASNPEPDWEKGRYAHLNNIELFYGDRFGEQGEMYSDRLYKIRVEEEFINNKSIIKNLVVIFPGKENYTGKDHPIARFKFEDCEKVFADSKYKWINPSNNAHVLDYGQALKEERYRVEAVFLVSLKNGTLYTSENPSYVTKKSNPSLRARAEEEAKRVMDSTRTIFSNNLSEQYFKYYAEGVFYKENKINKPYFIKGKELATYIVRAIREEKLKAYQFLYPSTILTPISVDSFDIMMRMPSGDDLPSANSFSARDLTFKINTELYVYANGNRKETIKTIDLIIPYNLETNIKGINYNVATVYAEDLFEILKRASAPSYYNTSNMADSCNFAEALKATKFQYGDLYVRDVYNRIFFDAAKDDDVLRISAGYGKPLDKSLFYTKQEDPVKANYYSFRDDIKNLDSIPSFYTKISDPTNTYNKFFVYRKIDLRKDKNKVMYRKGKELPRLLADGLREGKLKAYAGSVEDSNRVMVTDKVSISSFLKWSKHSDGKDTLKKDTSIDFYKDYSSLYYMATMEEFVYNKGDKKSTIKKIYIVNPILAEEGTYEFLLEFDYKDVLKFVGRDKKLLWFMKFNSYESEPVIAEDMFGGYYKLEKKDIYEKHKQLSVIR